MTCIVEVFSHHNLLIFTLKYKTKKKKNLVYVTAYIYTHYIHYIYEYIGLHYNNIYYVYIMCDYPSDVHYINLKPCILGAT